MKSSVKFIAVLFCLMLPAAAKAQSVGQVDCPRSGDYVYLYSSMTTLEVRTTLQCNEQVQITGRYDHYFGVTTARGEVGFVPVESLLLVKDKPGVKAQPKAVPSTRERTFYDGPSKPAEVAPVAPVSPNEFTLRNGTVIHLKLAKSISSATAHVGDVVELHVTEDVVVDGMLVVPEGAKAMALVTEAEPKKHLGHGGKLGFSVNFVQLKDNEKAAVRSFQEGTGANNSTGAVLPLSTGKEIVFPEGMEFTAYVDGDMQLKKQAFQSDKSSAATSPR
jgi:hypothetical protein